MADIETEVFQAPHWYSQDEVNHIREEYAANITRLADRLSEAADKLIATRARCEKLEKALEQIARGTSIIFDKNPQEMSSREARDIARAALEDKRGEQ